MDRMNICKNCGRPVNDVYCGHCGQKKITGRITLAFIWHEIFHFFTHLEKGFLFTSWQMIRRPGNTVTGFIEGRRKQYQSPVSYFLIWISIYILMLYLIGNVFGEKKVIDYKQYFGPEATTRIAIRNLSLVLTIVIPFQALYLYLLITQKKYNYFETMVMAIYVLGTVILFQFVFAVLAVVIHLFLAKTLDLRISDIFKVAFLAWAIWDITRVFKIRYRLVKASVFLILAFGTFTAWRLYGFPELMRMFSH